MLEPQGRRSVTGPMPAIGPGGSLPPRIRRRRFAAAFALLLLLGVAKFEIPRAAEASLAAGPGLPVRVAPGLFVGPAPGDGDLEQLADSGQIGGVVNLGAPSVAEQVTAAALHLAYLRLPVPLGGALTWRQLRVLVFFMRIHTTKGDSVYLHDTGDGRAATAAAMLLMLRGESRFGTVDGVGSTGFGAAQQVAIRQLGSALRPGHGPLPGNPYSAARRYSW
jgi:hypothetical protein